MSNTKHVTYALIYGLIGVAVVVCAVAAAHALWQIGVYTWGVT